MKLQLVEGDALQRLREIPDQSVNCVMTSPPYWNLRDYGVEEQIGQESHVIVFINKLSKIFFQVKRVLRDDGVCWINMGDTYQGGNLLGIPWMLINRLQSDGWVLRSSVIWHKPNPMPEPQRSTRWEPCRVKVSDGSRNESKINPDRRDGGRTCSDPWIIYEDCPGCPDCKETGGLVLKKGSWRPASSYESLFMLTKGMNYWTDGEAARIKDRNLRDVWTIPTQPFPESHFATFPEELVKRVLRCSCPQKICWSCLTPFVRVVEPPSGGVIGRSWNDHQEDMKTGNASDILGKHWKTYTPAILKGFLPVCSCEAGPYQKTGTVLDPFSGSGTVGAVAAEMGLNFIGIELNPDYLEISRKRISSSLQKVSLLNQEARVHVIRAHESLSEPLHVPRAEDPA